MTGSGGIRFFAFAAALEAAVAGAASIDLGRVLDIGRDVAAATTAVSEEEEVTIGREIAGRMLGAAPLVPDAALQAYVNRVGRWVALQSGRPDLPWHFGVLDTPTVNAFAAPGGYVLITRGLYEILDNEAQLAAVLGHEIGHIVQRHHITVMQKSAAISAGARLAQREGRSAFLKLLIGTGAEIFARGLDKSAEFEADRMGTVLAARAGYAPFGLIEMLHKLAARGERDDALALLFKTHPAPGERLSALGDAIALRLPELPAGKEPVILAVGAEVPPPARKPLPAEGARALPREEAAAPPPARGGQKGGGIGIDPGSLLRGIFGR